jgi:hypothetical protein
VWARRSLALAAGTSSAALLKPRLEGWAGGSDGGLPGVACSHLLPHSRAPRGLEGVRGGADWAKLASPSPRQ